MIVLNEETGRYEVRLTHDEFMELYHRWQQKPETQAMFEEIAADRRAFVGEVLADIRKSRQKSRGE